MGGPPGGDSLLSLSTRSAVQEELKLSDKQKAELNNLNEDYAQQRRMLFESMRPKGAGRGNGRRGQNGNTNGQNANNAAPGAINNGGIPAGGINGGGVAANSLNPYTSGYALNPYTLNQPQAVNPQQIQAGQQNEWQVRFQAMSQLDQQATSRLTRILNKKQIQRLSQIQIQSQGIQALLRPDVADKIQLDETQVEAIQGVINERRSAQRELFAKQANLFRSFRGRTNGANANGNGSNGAASQSANGSGTNAGPRDAANVGNNQGGDQGNRRRGGFGGPPDREAMKKFFEQPEVKAQLDQAQTDRDKLESRATQEAYKVMTRYQVASFKKLQGAPFDVSKLRPSFGGPRGTTRAGGDSRPASQPSDQATSEKPAPSQATSEPKKATSSKAKSRTKSSTKSRRAGSRQYQNFDDGNGFGDIPSGFE
jgi:hypothetical protein